MLADYEYFRVIGDCGHFRVEYLPNDGSPQRMNLDAGNEDDALFEASVIAECDPSELEIEWE